MEAHYEVSDAVYSKASIPLSENQPVYLWLGANVMVELTVDEAIAQLKKSEEQAHQSMEKLRSDLEFLKDQMTTSEVNIARVYNWDVRERRKKGVDGAGGSGVGQSG